MKLRRMFVVYAAAALPLGAIAAPAHAAPAVSGHERPVIDWREGTLERIKPNANKVVLTDRTVLRYDRNDIILTQHYFDVAPPDPQYPEVFNCDLSDTGGTIESDVTVARFAETGLEVSVDYLDLPRRDVSSFIFSIDSCDGVVDEADVTP